MTVSFINTHRLRDLEIIAMNKIVRLVNKNLPTDVFTDTDMAVLVNTSSDSRYGLIKRAIQHGEIIRLRRGLYVLAPEYRRGPLNTFVIAQRLYGPSYISLESALSEHGWIPEGVFLTTSVSLNRSRVFKTPAGEFMYGRVPQACLYEGVRRVAPEGGVYFMAEPLKALCDYVYLHKKDWRGVQPVIESLRVEPEALRFPDASLWDRLLENYHSRRVRAFIQGIRKDMAL